VILQVNDPDAHPLDKPPIQVNVLGNPAHGHVTAKPSATGNMNEPILQFPYGCYPTSFMSPAMYYLLMGYPQPGFPPHPSGFSVPPSSFVSHQGFAPPQGLTPGLPTATTSALSS